MAPVIFVNVLDPDIHKKTNTAQDVDVESLQAVVRLEGILPNSVDVKKVTGTGDDEQETALAVNTDYILSFDDTGYLVITLTASGAGATATKLRVVSNSIDPSAVTMNDVIGVSATGGEKFWYSAIMGALTAYTDAANDDVPYLSPSNKSLGITGTVMAGAVYDAVSGTWSKEVFLDQTQGNAVNSYGVTTAINNNGWKSWGNNTAAYPSTTDPKDRWFCCRRFFSWWGNSFILTYAQRVDDPASRQLIESIVDAENIRGNAYVAMGKCAAAYIEFDETENTVQTLLNGQIRFHQHLAPYTPAEDILNTLEFDTDALATALNGG